MSDASPHWIVDRGVCGWRVVHTGPTNMSVQPDQFGKIWRMSYRQGSAPPLTFAEVRKRVDIARAGLNGKRFGNAFSNVRRNVCCEYAAELNGEVQS